MKMQDETSSYETNCFLQGLSKGNTASQVLVSYAMLVSDAVLVEYWQVMSCL
jgi:hypothetical protein